MLKEHSIMVTGGTGSFGRKFIETVLTLYPEINRLVVFSRDELKQFEMAQVFPPEIYPQIRYFIGDVRDKERLARALQDIDIVIHAAALKQVPAAEYNPFECIKTNILGAQNVIETCLNGGVRKVVALSTDKAAGPVNLYGATKLCSDKLFVAANNIKGKRNIKFSVVRYGNVMGSRGSVIPLFLQQRHGGFLSITDKRMTRFNITLEHGVRVVLQTLEKMWGGEIYVPKIPSYLITDLAEAVAPDCQLRSIGMRPGEKLHEEMITVSDAINTVELQDEYVILPSMRLWDVDEFIEVNKAVRCQENFEYNSNDNPERLTVDELRVLIREHVDPGFTI
ncbi:MAG: UDP-N-acetylglucosamine 4,6-dehydratase (inverting) [Desulfobacca sp. 4484_104]|nr:MAG: UDP-N-acetylglucosamine 4,6-dehydratase (inverting) [Desulfobacca sp. 4484_104]